MTARLLARKGGLVTGGAKGIGAAAARLFVGEGAALLILDMDEAAGSALAQELGGTRNGVHYRNIDVTDEAAVAEAVDLSIKLFGRLDFAFNNAGTVAKAAPVHETESQDWNHVIRTNLTSMFYCMKHEIRVMREAGRGAIVNTSSQAGLVGVPTLSPYSASKHAILGLTKTAALENASAGIRINAVLPGLTDTHLARHNVNGNALGHAAMLPCGRAATSDEIAEAALWLCSDRASYVSGASMLVDMAALAR